MEPNFLPPGFSRETEIRRDARGRWFNGTDVIEHPNVVRAFNGWIELAEDGRFCLRNDLGWAYFTLEGPPYFVEAVREAEEGLSLVLSGDHSEPLVPETLGTDAEGRLHCFVLGGGLRAEFRTHAAVQLSQWMESDGEQAVFVHSGKRIPLGEIA